MAGIAPAIWRGASADGFYRIVDRLKDMYVSGGENVYPAEVEAVLLAHPDVADAAVLGVARSALGRVRRRVRRPAGWNSVRSRRRSRPTARRASPDTNARRAIVAIDAIPRSAAGKILKPVLRARLNAGEFA